MKVNNLSGLKKSVFVPITAVALLIQSLMLVLFYSLPDSLGLSLSEMFAGKTIWQIFMALGGVLTMSGIFAFLRKPRGLVIFFVVYFFLAVADYEVFRFSHQRLSYSFIRTYFHFSNITDPTTISTMGGDLAGTLLWLSLLFLVIAGGLAYVIICTIRKTYVQGVKPEKRIATGFVSFGLLLSIIPLILFLAGIRGVTTVPLINAQIDWRFTLGKHTLTAPILHIAAVETFEFFKDNYSITKELRSDLDSFLPADMVSNRSDEESFPVYRQDSPAEFKATHPYNIVLIFGESFKGRVINQMLDGDSALAPNLWKLANGGYHKVAVNSSGDSIAVGGSLWFKNTFSGGYPTVRGTSSTYLGFPSHPNRDVPCFYASNHFVGFPEMLADYVRGYMTVSNPVFDHTLPFVEKFFGDNWRLPEEPTVEGSIDSLGVNASIDLLSTMPTDKKWLMVTNTIATHIPFRNYPLNFAPQPEDAMVRYRNSLLYTDTQLGRFFDVLSKRPDFENTVVIILGDHDTPVDSVDYAVPQPLGVATTRIFMGIFAADSSLIQGLQVREDAASQLDVGPTILDLANVRQNNHFWGYDLLTQERPADQPTVFFSQNAYYLGFRDSVLVGGLENEEVYVGKNETFSLVNDSASVMWRKKAIGASKVLRSLLRNDNMMPHK